MFLTIKLQLTRHFLTTKLQLTHIIHTIKLLLTYLIPHHQTSISTSLLSSPNSPYYYPEYHLSRNRSYTSQYNCTYHVLFLTTKQHITRPTKDYKVLPITRCSHHHGTALNTFLTRPSKRTRHVKFLTTKLHLAPPIPGYQSPLNTS